MSPAEVLAIADAHATVSIRDAARCLGVGKNAAYSAARRGEIAGVPVLRVGISYRVPTAEILRALGLPLPKRKGAR